jgi:hypothetical protein
MILQYYLYTFLVHVSICVFRLIVFIQLNIFLISASAASSRFRWAGYAEYIGKNVHAYRALVGKP